jgi:hypothetical protein
MGHRYDPDWMIPRRACRNPATEKQNTNEFCAIMTGPSQYRQRASSDSLFYVVGSATQLAFGGLESCGELGSNLMTISRP